MKNTFGRLEERDVFIMEAGSIHRLCIKRGKVAKQYEVVRTWFGPWLRPLPVSFRLHAEYPVQHLPMGKNA